MEWLNNIGEDNYNNEYIESINIDDENEWLQDRLGMITGSNFGKLIVKSKDRKNYMLSTGKVAGDLIYKIAWERLLKSGNISNGLGRLSISSKSMQHGEDYEGEAIHKYMEETGFEVDYTQRFVAYDDFIGGTPDGYIGDKGIIEVKCPFNGGNHLKSMLTNTIYNPEYIYQIQGYLWVTKRDWCDFVTYDPDLIDGLQINIIRVKRDEDIIKGISDVMDIVKEKIREIIDNEKLQP